MGKQRINFVVAIIGTARTGKTTQALSFSSQYKKRFRDRNVLFVSPHETEQVRWSGENSLRFKADKIISPEQLEEFRRLRKLPEKRKFEYLYGATKSLIVLDDVKLYSSSQGLEITSLLAKRGHIDADILIIYHSFLEVPPKLWGYFNEIWMMRINERPDVCLKRAQSGIFTASHILHANKLQVGEMFIIKQNALYL